LKVVEEGGKPLKMLGELSSTIAYQKVLGMDKL